MPTKTQQQLRAEGYTLTQGGGSEVEVWEKPGATSAHATAKQMRDPDTGEIVSAEEMPGVDVERLALRLWRLEKQIERMDTRLVAIEAALPTGGGR